MSLHIVILAAGLGKRMYSKTPKVLHKLAGTTLLSRVVHAAQELNPEKIHIIYGNGGQEVRKSLDGYAVNWVHQEKQLGTGHAVLQALPYIPDEAKVVVLSADVPLIQAKTLQSLIDKTGSKAELSLLLANLPDPTGLGRIIRNAQEEIIAIVEEKDASPEQKRIHEIYSGICCAKAQNLKRWLPMLGNNNAQGEFYLTDIIALAVAEAQSVHSITANDNLEIQGVNNQLQLQQLERVWQYRQAEYLMLAGVHIADAQRFDLRGELQCGQDVFIDINCVFIGKVTLEDGCRIGPGCVLSNTHIAADSEIFAHSVLDGCQIGKNCHIGPFARLRPGTQLGAECKIGNFVETKNASLDSGSKASHLSYLGDATIGKEVNIGAGTITCNYDGANKYQTVIEDGVFVGSDTQFIAPVKIGAQATIGAGSTIRKNVPPGELTLTETKQKTIYGWKRPVKHI